MSKTRGRNLISATALLTTGCLLAMVITHSYAYRDLHPPLAGMDSAARPEPMTIEDEKWHDLPVDKSIVHQLNAYDRVMPSKSHYRSFPGILADARKYGTVLLPEGATIGAPCGQPGKHIHYQLARWFAESHQHQEQAINQRTQFGTPFSIYSSIYPHGVCVSQYGSVDVKSLRICGKILVLKLDCFKGPYGTKQITWMPLVEVPVLRRLPVGQYLLIVDWADDVDFREIPKGTISSYLQQLKGDMHHVVIFSVMK